MPRTTESPDIHCARTIQSLPTYRSKGGDSFRRSSSALGECLRLPLSGSEFCIFHKPDKTKEEAKLFAKGIRTKFEKKDYDFSGFVFPEPIMFPWDFGISVLEGDVNFSNAQFLSDASFERIKFKGNVSFCGVTFKMWACFSSTQFQEAYFHAVVFLGISDFTDAQFKKADFGGCEFVGASFIGARFEEEASFNPVLVKLWARFDGAHLRNVDFQGARFPRLTKLLPSCVRGNISLKEASVENVYMAPLNLRKGASIDFKSAQLRNTELTRSDIEGYIKQEMEGDFAEAS